MKKILIMLLHYTGKEYRDDYLVYLLGIIGWVLVLVNAPFGWELPVYAGY